MSKLYVYYLIYKKRHLSLRRSFMSTRIKSVINNLFASNATSWQTYVLTNWKTIIGDLHTHVCVEKIENTTLVLGVHDSCMLQELYLLSSLLLERINKNLEKPYIKQIRLKMATHAAPSVFKQKVPVLSKYKKLELSPAQERALEAIADVELRQALTAFFIRCNQETS